MLTSPDFADFVSTSGEERKFNFMLTLSVLDFGFGRWRGE